MPNLYAAIPVKMRVKYNRIWPPGEFNCSRNMVLLQIIRSVNPLPCAWNSTKAVQIQTEHTKQQPVPYTYCYNYVDQGFPSLSQPWNSVVHKPHSYSNHYQPKHHHYNWHLLFSFLD